MFYYPQQPNFSNNRPSTNLFMPTQPFLYRSNGGPMPNRSTHNLNFTHDFDRFATPHHGFASIPSGGQPFFDYNNQNLDQQRRRQNMARAQQQQQHHQQQQQHRRTPAFHFQDKSTSYFMTDPVFTSDDRITIHLTKVHVGPNGDQQRVFVEQEFSNENELNKFVQNLRQNFEKTFNHRSPTGNSQTDESVNTESKTAGVVVVEEPDEEPKIYPQQAYNDNIESKRAAASILTPPASPSMDSLSASKSREPSPAPPPPPPTTEHQRRKQTSPPASQMSSSSNSRSNRHYKNKTKYRRQPVDTHDETKSSRVFHMPSFSRQYPATPTPPPRFQARSVHPNNEPNRPPNPNFAWRYHQNGYPKNRSRSYVPPMNDNFPSAHPPPPTPSRFQNLTDPFFRPIHPSRFVHYRPKDIRPPPSPSRLRRSHRRKGHHQPTTITENHIYPNHDQQQPRVHRTKSECRNFQKEQQRRSRSTTNNCPKFSPLQQPPTVQRHFIPFRSPPVILTSVHSTTPLFYPNQRRQFPNNQPQLHLINPFRLGTNRF